MKSADKSIHNVRVGNPKQWKWHSWTMQWSNTSGAPNGQGQESRRDKGGPELFNETS
jgi:hypothetical protein